MEKLSLGKVTFDLCTLEELIINISDSISARTLQTVITPNLDMWYRIQNTSQYDCLIREFTKVIPDGMPIARALTRISGVHQSRVTGSDLLPSLILKMQGSGVHFCFIGGPPEVAKKCADIASAYGLVGSYLNAPMNLLGNSVSQKKLVEQVLEIDFDVLVLGFGFPLQEILSNNISKIRGSGIYLNVGMALLYLSGKKTRAPRILQRSGLEWLFRLLSEPIRLFHRYVISGPKAYILLRRKSRKV